MWETLISPITSIINKLIPDKAAAAKAAEDLRAMAAQGELEQELAELKAVTSAQTDINKVEASNPSRFVAGWRPFIGWGCGFAFIYVSIVEPIARFVAEVIYHYAGQFPVIDTTITMQVLLGMLGMGTLRTYEKLKNVDTKAVGN